MQPLVADSLPPPVLALWPFRSVHPARHGSFSSHAAILPPMEMAHCCSVPGASARGCLYPLYVGYAASVSVLALYQRTSGDSAMAVSYALLSTEESQSHRTITARHKVSSHVIYVMVAMRASTVQGRRTDEARPN